MRKGIGILCSVTLFSWVVVAGEMERFSASPSYIIPNHAHAKTGKRLVADSRVQAMVQTVKGRVLFTDEGAYFSVQTHEQQSAKQAETSFETRLPRSRTVVLKAGFSLENTKRTITPRFEQTSGGTINVLVGARESWQQGLSAYRKLVYDQVWEGISLEFLGYMDRLAYQLQIEAGGDPTAIVMETGASWLRVTETGQLIAGLEGGELHMSKPYAWQIIDGEKVEVAVAYRVLEGGRYGFTLGKHNPAYPLTIDPELTWGTHLGGSGDYATEVARAVVTDSAGNFIVAGNTYGANFPVTEGAYDTTYNGQVDGFVSKLSEDGSELYWSTFLGGSLDDTITALALDGSENVVVVGTTESADFPTTAGAQSETKDGGDDAFLARIDTTGTALTYATYLGGANDDSANSVAVDSTGAVYVTGTTESSDFPTTTGAYNTTYNGLGDAFVVKFAADLTSLEYSTFLGSSEGLDAGYGIVVDGDAAIVTGSTASSGYPITAGAYDTSHNGNDDGFLTKLTSDGSSLQYSTFIGGSGEDEAYALTLENGVVYVTGFARSTNFPISAGAYNVVGQLYNVFVSGFFSASGGLALSTVIGGRDLDIGRAIAADATGIYVTGSSKSSDFPLSEDAYQPTNWGGDESGFVLKLSLDATERIYSTIITENNREISYGLVLDGAGNAVVVGSTQSTAFPSSTSALEPEPNFGEHYLVDGFLTKIDATGSAVLFSTLLSGSGQDAGQGITTDSVGNVYVTGYTKTHDFPTTVGAFDEVFNGATEAFVSKMSSDGTTLIFSTILGGGGRDVGQAIVVDSAGNALVVGLTTSTNFPTTAGALSETHSGGLDGFLVKLNSTGSVLNYGTYLGGSGNDEVTALAIDEDDAVYLAGTTTSADLPTTAGAYDETYNQQEDVFLARITTSNSLSYLSYLGGTGADRATGIAVDGGGSAYVAGYTASSAFPTTNQAYRTDAVGGVDGFLTKVDANGANLTWSTYLGGTSDDLISDVAVDSQGRAYVVGTTESDDFPTTPGAWDRTKANHDDVFVTKFNFTGSSLQYSTYIGHNQNDTGEAIAVDEDGQAYITGYGGSQYPVTEETGYNWGAMVTLLNATATDLHYARYIANGLGQDVAYHNGLLYITGYSTQASTTAGVYQQNPVGGSDAFVIQMSFCAPNLGNQLSDVTVCTGEDVTFTVTPTGIDPFSYQWQKDGVDIPSATEATLQIGSAMFADMGEYSCVVTNSCGSDTTNAATLTVNESVNILAQPEDTEACVGEEVTFAVTATGSGLLTYQWYRDGLEIEGATSPTYSFEADTGATYYCDITNVCGSTTSDTATLTISQSITITAQPMGADKCAGETTSFTVTAQGATSYQWYKDGEPIDGADGATYTTGVLTGKDSGNYRCLLGGACGESTSEEVALTVSEVVEITGQPVGATTCPGEDVSLSVTTTGAFDTYQWQKDGVDLSGETAATLLLENVSAAEMGSYRCVVTNGCSEETSSAAVLTLRQPIAITQQPQNIATCLGGDVTFTLAVTGSEPLLYQWQKDRTDLPGATEDTLTITAVTEADLATYNCLITNLCGTISSEPATLSEGDETVEIIEQPEQVAACTGESASFTVGVQGSGPIGYQWYKDGVMLAGEQTATLTLTAVTAADAGDYDCEVSNPCGASLSESATLTVDAEILAQATPAALPQGLNPPTFDVAIRCAIGAVEVAWTADPPTTLLTDGSAVSLDPAPTVTTLLEATITDEENRETTVQAIFLVPVNSGFQDYNGDGCNTIHDLWDLSQFWLEQYQADPNDDGVLDVRDLLYIDAANLTSCNPGRLATGGL